MEQSILYYDDYVVYYDMKGITMDMISELMGALKTKTEKRLFLNNYEQIYKSCLRSLIHSPALRLTKLSGPSIFFFYPNVKYTNKQGILSHKRILLLGERHDNTKPCVPSVDFTKGEYDVHRYLMALGEILDEKNDSENDSERLDIFVEADYKIIKKPWWYRNRLLCKGLEYCDHPLESIINVMNNSELFPNSIRWHYTDTRRMEYSLYLHKDFVTKMFLEKYSVVEFIIERALKVYDINKLLSYLVGLKTENLEYYLSFCEFIYKEAYPLDTYEGSDIEFKLRKHEEKLMIPLIKKRIRKADLSESDVKILLERVINASQMPTVLYKGLLTIRMDTYTLLRMFTVFDKNVTSKNNVPKNIILHAGASHTSVVKEVLNLYAFSKINAGDMNVLYDISASQCIELDQPFNYFSA